MQPIFAFTLGTLFLGEEPGLLVALGTPVIVAGLALVLTSRASRDPSQGFSRTQFFGYLLAIASAGAFSTRDVISRHVVSGVAPALGNLRLHHRLGQRHAPVSHAPQRHTQLSARAPFRFTCMCILAGACSKG